MRIRRVRLTFKRDGWEGYAVLETAGNYQNDDLIKTFTNSKLVYDLLTVQDTEKDFDFEIDNFDNREFWVAELLEDKLILSGDYSDVLTELNLVSIEILQDCWRD
ncbi:hypothetical protein B1156_14855 [Enterococcus faecium]|uniref:hypothetical protein n=1 Tax=Enterococcus faecium TaxID=1352 RepID=UPI000DEA15C2|nr:hypothetical protein [Enterococcus faecium]RCF55712.1 hypothetical protein B1156_14855 [Enterococcus faecium]